MMGSWGLISDVDHKALWGFPTYTVAEGNDLRANIIIG